MWERVFKIITPDYSEEVAEGSPLYNKIVHIGKMEGAADQRLATQEACYSYGNRYELLQEEMWRALKNLRLEAIRAREIEMQARYEVKRIEELQVAYDRNSYGLNA